MRDFIGAIKAGATNEQLNEAMGTKDKDFIGAIEAGATNEQLNIPFSEQSNETIKQDTEVKDEYLGDIKDEVLSEKPTIESTVSREPENEENDTPLIFEEDDTIQTFKSKFYSKLQNPEDVKSYDDVNTYGFEYPERGFKEVVLGKGSSPQELQEKANNRLWDEYLLSREIETGDLEEQSDLLVDILGVGAKTAASGIAIYATYKGAKTLAGKAKAKHFMDTIEAEITTGRNADKVKKYRELVESEYPEEMQGLAFAEYGSVKSEGFISKALDRGEDAARNAYAERIMSRVKALDETAQIKDMEAKAQAVRTGYDNVVKEVENIAINDKGFDTTIFRKKLNDISEEFDVNEATENTIRKLIDRIDKENVQTIGGVLNIRKWINSELAKAQGKSSAPKWKAMKEELDGYMKQHIPKEAMDMVEHATDMWKEMRHNEEMISIINKKQHRKYRGAEGFDVSAIDWKSLNDDLKNAGLDSPEIKATMQLTETFAKRFGTMDADLFSKLFPEGAGTVDVLTTNPAEGIMRLFNKLGVNKIVDYFSDARAAQNAIMKGILASDSQEEFVKYVISSGKFPSEIEDEFLGFLNNYRAARKNATIPAEVKQIEPDEIISVPEAKPKSLPSPKRDVVDTEIVGKGSKNKNRKLTPEQAKRNNEIVDKINKNLSQIESRKRGLVYLRKSKGKNNSKTIDRYEAEIRRLEAENITLEKKKPKI